MDEIDVTREIARRMGVGDEGHQVRYDYEGTARYVDIVFDGWNIEFGFTQADAERDARERKTHGFRNTCALWSNEEDPFTRPCWRIISTSDPLGELYIDHLKPYCGTIEEFCDALLGSAR